MTEHDIGTMYLVGGYCERINVALFRGDAVREVELLWVEQFRCHIADDAWFGRHRCTWLHDCRISYDTVDPEIPQACDTIISDQDVSLDRTNIGARLELGTHSALTGLISLWTILSECRYSRPQAACASYEGKSQTIFLHRSWRSLTSCKRLAL